MHRGTKKEHLVEPKSSRRDNKCAISSMTGFGFASIDEESGRFVAEIRSVNSRYSEVRIFGLREDFSLEFELGKMIKQRFDRGKFDLTLRKEISEKKVQSNEEKKIKAHHLHLKKLQKSLGIKGEIGFETVLRTFSADRAVVKNDDKDHQQFIQVTEKALKKLSESRQKEGAVLLKDIQVRFFQIVAWFDQIEKQVPILKEKKQSEIENKIQTAVKDLPIDTKRIEGEIALMIEKSDVTEEIVRFKKHLQSFKHILLEGSSKNSVGRELDFTLQEMHREINTLGAKIGEVELSRMVVNIKSEMEKIREQVQNIE